MCEFRSGRLSCRAPIGGESISRAAQPPPIRLEGLQMSTLRPAGKFRTEPVLRQIIAIPRSDLPNMDAARPYRVPADLFAGYGKPAAVHAVSRWADGENVSPSPSLTRLSS